MKNYTLSVILIVSLFFYRAQGQSPLSYSELAGKVIEKGLKETDLATYQGSLLLQAMSELAVFTQDKALLDRTVEIYKKFGSGEIKAGGSFLSYKFGGNGACWLNYKGATPALDAQSGLGAKQMFTLQSRSAEGLIIPNWIDQKSDKIFIDMAFAVSPYMLYAGLKEKNEQYVEIAVNETLELFRILGDAKTRLIHQARGFNAPGELSQDNWSRGNGWAALAIASLIRDLPKAHPRRREVEQTAIAFFKSVLKHQDRQGLWHQEMTQQSSFTETSGSGLLLYGLGIMIEQQLLDNSFRDPFEKGVAALTQYVAMDGSVSNACYSCLAPRAGTKLDYVNHVWIYNDSHGFGPVILALAQAEKLKIKPTRKVLNKIGERAVADTISRDPRAYVKYAAERSQDIAWENDRIAFRYYGPPVRDKVSSGIDVWVKSVEYPVVEKWYRLNSKGLDYHVDRGEGLDFYHMGFLRGCGGTAVWLNGKVYPSQTYSNHRIIKNDPKEIEFELFFENWDVAGRKVAEHKRIRMRKGTNFFEVTSTFKTDQPGDLTVGIGLTTFGSSSVIKDPGRGILASWENIPGNSKALGTAVVAEPARILDYKADGQDRYVLIKVKPGETVKYYVGAAWQGNPRFEFPESWPAYLHKQCTWTKLTGLYAR